MNDMEEIRLRGELARTREERDRLRESEAELHRIRQGLILDNDRLREALAKWDNEVYHLKDRVEDLEAELARLRGKLIEQRHEYAGYMDELARLREALTLIGGYHYSTREAKDLCDIANDALREAT